MTLSTHRIFVLLLWSCYMAGAVDIHWSAGTNEVPFKPARIYITGPGVASLSDVKAAQPHAPLEQVAPGVWHLRAELVVENGGKLVLYGTKIGGDVNVLRLQSNNRGDPLHDLVFVRADWGTLDIRSTSITSWDDDATGPDTEYSSFGRSYINVRSSLDLDGVTIHESRMDIQDSEISYLGSHRPEAYGLVWKVSAQKTNSPTYGAITNLYKVVNVYGDILRTRIHHNYFGMYSFGAYGMHLADNEMDHNVGYGFDPHDDSDYLIIERNNVHHNGTHGIIASQRCNNTIVRDNTTWNNGGCGIMLHRYCDDSIIERNRSFHNGDAGIALFDVRHVTVRSNSCVENFNAGVRCSVGAADNLIEDNEIADGANFGLYLYKGVDAPFPGDNGHCKRNVFRNNYVHGNTSSGIFLTTCDDNTFSGNIFDANGTTMWLINGQRNHLESNAIPRNVTVRIQGVAALPSSTYLRNEPEAMIQVDPFSTATFEDSGGAIFDPEEPGIATTVTTNGSSLQLTTLEIGKTSRVLTRNFRATPDAGIALISIIVWNTTGDLSKRWLTQASSSTRKVTYHVGDLTPGVRYQVLKGGVATIYTADSTGNIIFQDTSVTTGVTEFTVMF